MKKHQATAIVLIIILAIIVGIVIFASKKSTDPVSTTSAPHETLNPNPPLGTYTTADVATHNSQASCYTTISGSVYDLTPWINQHPGGSMAILSLCGKDGTVAFNAQHGGQGRPETELASFKIGTLVQ